MSNIEKEDLPLIEYSSAKTKWNVFLMVLGVVLIAATLRAPITSVGPVIAEITDQFKLTPTLVGLITAIPLISFALLSAFAPKVSRQLGLERFLLYSLLILAIGLFVRSAGNVFLLFLGAALIGAAITVGNVLMPAFIKREFPTKVGLITGFYLVSMNFTSALAAGYSIKIGQISGLGWKGSIGIWGVLALVAFVLWLPQVKKKPVLAVQDKVAKNKSFWKSNLAWQISIFMGLQSILFYCLAAWLPLILQSWGMSSENSGWALSYIQLGQLPIMLISPIIAARMKDQTPLVLITFVLLIAGLLGIILGKTDHIIICVILIGISLGLAFTLAMMFFVLRTKQTSDAANLSGMAQSVGYLIAAGGPPLFGALFSLTGSWYVPLIFLVIVSIILLIVGLGSAKNRYVTSDN